MKRLGVHTVQCCRANRDKRWVLCTDDLEMENSGDAREALGSNQLTAGAPFRRIVFFCTYFIFISFSVFLCYCVKT